MSVELENGFRIDRQQLVSYIEEEFVNKRKSPILIPQPNPKLSTKFLPLSIVEQNLSPLAEDHFKIVMATIPTNYPPSSLTDFNYFFNDKGELRNMLKNDEPFHFISQRHYEAIGDFIVREIQWRMVRDCGLKELWLPLDDESLKLDSLSVTAQDQQRILKNNIFLSSNWETADKLMLLIQGSGAVRAGQWARALCMNESLETGSQIPYIQQAHMEGYAVVVFNPNLNCLPKKEIPDRYTRKGFLMTDKPSPLPSSKYEEIPEHESPPTHVITVWDQFVSKAQAKDIVIVAHSAGGYCTMQLLKARHPEVLKKLRGIAFTDSVHSVSLSDPAAMREFICNHATNWVTSDTPLDTLIQPASRYGCRCLSAGHTRHENTSASCQVSAFRYLAEKIEEYHEKQQ
jgi:hypothetical protein